MHGTLACIGRRLNQDHVKASDQLDNPHDVPQMRELSKYQKYLALLDRSLKSIGKAAVAVSELQVQLQPCFKKDFISNSDTLNAQFMLKIAQLLLSQSNGCKHMDSLTCCH